MSDKTLAFDYRYAKTTAGILKILALVNKTNSFKLCFGMCKLSSNFEMCNRREYEKFIDHSEDQLTAICHN